MAFQINNYVIDRVLRAYLLNSDDDLLGYLDNLTECSIEMGSESQDVTDAQGVLIKRFYRSKTASLSATNALWNLDVSALQLGSTKTSADSTSFTMPYSLTVAQAAAPATTPATVTLPGYVSATANLHVWGLDNSGNPTVEYDADTTADTDKYAVTSGGVVTLPKTTDETQFFVFYTRTVSADGVKYSNSATVFPQTVKIRIEVLGYDVCDTTASTPQLMVIAGDSFNIAPDATIAISGGDSQTIDFSGEFASSYCSADKELFSIYLAED